MTTPPQTWRRFPYQAGVQMATYRANYSPGNWIVVAGPNLLVLLEPDLRRAAPKLERIWSDVNTCKTLDELVASLVQWGPEASAAAIFQVVDNRLRLTYRGQSVILDANSGAVVADGGGSPVWRTIEPSTAYIQVNLGPEALGSQRVPLLMGIVGASSFTLDARIGATEPRRQIGRPKPPTSPAPDGGEDDSVLDRFGLHGLLGIAQPLDGWEVPANPLSSAPAVSARPAAMPTVTPQPAATPVASQPVTPRPSQPTQTPRPAPEPLSWPSSWPSAQSEWPEVDQAAWPVTEPTAWPSQPAWPATPDVQPASEAPGNAAATNATPPPAAPAGTESTGVTATEAAWMAAMDGLRTPPAAPKPEPQPVSDWPVPPAIWPVPAQPQPMQPESWAAQPQPAQPEWDAQAQSWETQPQSWDDQASAEPAQPYETPYETPYESPYDAAPAAPYETPDQPAPASGPGTPAFTMTDIEEATQRLIDQLAQPLIADWMVEPFSPEVPDQAAPPVTTRAASEPTTQLGDPFATLAPAPASYPAPEPEPTPEPEPVWDDGACVLSFGEGMDVPIDGVVIIGRAPQAGNQEHARLIKISSSTHGLSRSHVRVEPIRTGFLVSDLRSTNGTEIQTPGNDLVALDPDAPQVVPVGTLIRLGGTIEARIEAA